MRLIITLVCVTLCLAVTTARRPGPRGSRLREACEVRNVTSGDIVRNKTCGCGNVTVDCSWGPIPITHPSGDQLVLTFCDMSDYINEDNATFPGVLRGACLIEGPDGSALQNKSCRGERTCTVGPQVFPVGGQRWNVTFCTSPTRGQRKNKRNFITGKAKHHSADSTREDSSGASDDEDEQRSDCININATSHHVGSRARGGAARGDKDGAERRRPSGDRDGAERRRPPGDRDGAESRRQRGDRDGAESRRQRGDRDGAERRRSRGDRDGAESRRQRGDRDGAERRRSRGDRDGAERRRPSGDSEGAEERNPRGDGTSTRAGRPDEQQRRVPGGDGPGRGERRGDGPGGGGGPGRGARRGRRGRRN